MFSTTSSSLLLVLLSLSSPSVFAEKGDARRPGDPIYWEAYRQKHGLKFRRCRDFAGHPPSNGSVCNKKKIGDYFCLFGDQVCAGDKEKHHHPTTWCDCEENNENSNRHWQCREHLPDECVTDDDDAGDQDENMGDENESTDDDGEEFDDDSIDDKFFDPDTFFDETLDFENMDETPPLGNDEQVDGYTEGDFDDEDYDQDDEDYDEIDEEEDDFCNGNELIEGHSASGSSLKRAKSAAKKLWVKKVQQLMPLEPEQADWNEAELADYDCHHYSDGHYKCKAFGIPCVEEDDDMYDEDDEDEDDDEDDEDDRKKARNLLRN